MAKIAIQAEQRAARFVMAVAAAFQVAGMIAGAIGSAKAAKAQAAQQAAILQLLFSISKQLSAVNDGIEEILEILDELPEKIKQEFERFEAERYRATILGSYQLFLEKKTDFLRRPDIWGEQKEVDDQIDEYEKLLFEVQKASRSLMAFPLNSTPLKEATICLAFQAEMDIIAELTVLGAETEIGAAAKTYEVIFTDILKPKSDVRKRIEQLRQDSKNFGSELSDNEMFNASYIGFMYLRRGISDFYKNNTTITKIEESEVSEIYWDTKSDVFVVTESPIHEDVGILDIEYNRKETCHEYLIHYLEGGKVVSSKSGMTPEGCRDKKKHEFNDARARKFRAFISGFNAISFEVVSWMHVLSAASVCLDQAKEIESANDYDPRIIGSKKEPADEGDVQ